MLTLGLYGVADRRGELVAHDHGVAVMRHGTVLTNLELERVTGRKHDHRLRRYFDELVLPWLSNGEPVRVVQVNSFLGSSFASDSGSLTVAEPAEDRLAPRLVPSSHRASGPFADLSIEAFTVSHELAHVGSCLPFYGCPPPKTLLVHIDGGASVSANSAWFWDGNEVRLLEHSWDTLKAAVNNFNSNPLSARMLGLSDRDHLSMPGKLMGFASYGSPDPSLQDWLRDHDFFLGCTDPDLLRQVGRYSGRISDGDPTRQQHHHNIAACMQAHFEDQVLDHLRRLRLATGASCLYYAGGAALNVHANARIERELGFDRVCIPPAPSDCGLAIGGAAVAEWLTGSAVRQHGPYLTQLTPTESLHFPPGAATPEIARRLANGQVVAAVFGRAEVGPRALGHRSLLARPDRVDLRRDLSERMKRREWYRPVAPMLLPDTAARCLEGFKAGSPLARYMLGAWRVKPEWLPAFRGCVHVDGTVRAQVLEPDEPEQTPLVELLYLLRREHGIHGLINTSLNTRGYAIPHVWAVAREQARLVGAHAVWSA